MFESRLAFSVRVTGNQIVADEAGTKLTAIDTVFSFTKARSRPTA